MASTATQTLALARSMLAATAPNLTQSSTSVLVRMLNAVVTTDANTQIALQNVAPDLTYTTAQGTALIAKAADFGAAISTGQAAGDFVVFYTQSPAINPVSIAIGQIVGTGGDASSTQQIQFATTALTAILVGQTLANTFVGVAVNTVGTSVGTGLSGHINASGTQPTLIAAVWTITATGTGTYTLTKTITVRSGTTTTTSTTTVATGLTTGTVYDDANHIPGIAFEVTGSLTNLDSAHFATGGAPTPVRCTAPGSAGNVAPGTILSTSLSQGTGISVSNDIVVQGVSNPNGGNHGASSPNALGIDADTPGQVVDKIAQRATPLNSNQNAVKGMLAVPGVAFASLYDPSTNGASPTGYVYWYAAKADGTLDGIPGGTTNNAASMPSNPPYLTLGGSLTGTAALVLAAVQGAVSWAVSRAGGDGGTASPFAVNFVTNVTLTYTLQVGAQATTVDPIIQGAITAYLQALGPGNSPTTWDVYKAVNAATGGAVQNITALSMTIANSSPHGTSALDGSGLDNVGIPQLCLPSSSITYTITP